jgi:hypothetical protein
MAWSNQARAVGAGVLLVSLLTLPTGLAYAAKGVFVRSKPHVNVSKGPTLVVRGSQAHAKPKDPWSRRPRLKCVRLKDSPGLYCR